MKEIIHQLSLLLISSISTIYYLSHLIANIAMIKIKKIIMPRVSRDAARDLHRQFWTFSDLVNFVVNIAKCFRTLFATLPRSLAAIAQLRNYHDRILIFCGRTGVPLRCNELTAATRWVTVKDSSVCALPVATESPRTRSRIIDCAK